MNGILDLVLAHTYTRVDALRRLRILKQLLEGRLFGLDQQPELIPQDSVWLNQLDTKIYNFFNRQNLYSLIDEVEKFIKQVLTLTIYLPFELPDTELIALGEYLRKDYGKNFLVEIKFDSNLIGGCSLIWKSILKDYSLKKRMEDSREVILGNLKQSLKK
ncbi:hypothetical protein HYW46_01295 [Candidatus Daviesbacteria bacterium]|nr:hypothetical protein [Candidatus Daviesbacteria bacterium]